MVDFRTSRSSVNPNTVHYIGEKTEQHYDIVTIKDTEPFYVEERYGLIPRYELYKVFFNHEPIAAVRDYDMAECIIYRHAEGKPIYEPRGSIYYVNEYFVDQLYGGPEEGGWWFEYGRFTRCIGQYHDINLAWHVQRGFQKILDNEVNAGRPSITSVVSEGVYKVRLDNLKGQDYPTYQPRYE